MGEQDRLGRAVEQETAFQGDAEPAGGDQFLEAFRHGGAGRSDPELRRCGRDALGYGRVRQGGCPAVASGEGARGEGPDGGRAGGGQTLQRPAAGRAEVEPHRRPVEAVGRNPAGFEAGGLVAGRRWRRS